MQGLFSPFRRMERAALALKKSSNSKDVLEVGAKTQRQRKRNSCCRETVKRYSIKQTVRGARNSTRPTNLKIVLKQLLAIAFHRSIGQSKHCAGPSLGVAYQRVGF